LRGPSPTATSMTDSTDSLAAWVGHTVCSHAHPPPARLAQILVPCISRSHMHANGGGARISRIDPIQSLLGATHIKIHILLSSVLPPVLQQEQQDRRARTHPRLHGPVVVVTSLSLVHVKIIEYVATPISISE
jgi:hypothetical protein